MTMKFVPALAALLFAAAPAFAQAPAPTAEKGGRMAACRVDVATHCAGVEAGGGRRIQCLTENKAKLTPECAQVVEARGAKGGGRRERDGANAEAGAAVNVPAGAAVGPAGSVGDAKEAAPAGKSATDDKRGGGRMAACKTDVATFCGTADKGKARGQCLKENQAKLSPECQAAIGEHQARSGALREACKVDRDSLCASVGRGGGRMIQCLRDNREKLTPQCGDALTSVPERGRGKGKRA